MKAKRIFKFLSFLLVAVLALSLFSCGQTEDNSGNNDNQGGDSTDTTERQVDFPANLSDLSVRSYTGSNGVVSAASPYAAQAGLYVLQKGGNAFEAAVAVAFALGVVEGNASGIGGGGIMVAYDANEGDFVGYNFREFVPALGTASNAQGMTSDAGKTPGALRAAGVPTEVAGLLTILEEKTSGKVTRSDVMAPAIELAEYGFAVTPELANQLSNNIRLASEFNYDQFWAIFSNDGIEPVKAGETLVQKDYAKTLKLIRDNGKDGFYKGEVAEAIVKANGPDATDYAGRFGLITQEDLDYAVENYPLSLNPLVSTYHGYTVASSNIPSSGGIILIEALNMLDSYFGKTGLAQLGHNSAEYINAVGTALYLAYGDKRKYIADYDHDSALTDYRKVLTNRQYAIERFNSAYIPGAATRASLLNPYYGDPGTFAKEHGISLSAGIQVTDEAGDDPTGTTSFSVADKEGNIVSVTQTLNHFFGNGVMPEGYGFYMNNNLTSFSTTASSVHIVKPFKQPVSHIMPTIVLDPNGNPFATLGSPGSMRLVSAVTETILNLIDFGMGMQEAIEAARFYSYPGSGLEYAYREVEQYGDITPEVMAQLEAMGYDLHPVVDGVTSNYEGRSLYFGGVHGIKFNADGTMTGGADPRRDGKAVGF